MRCTTDVMIQAYRYPQLKPEKAFLIQHQVPLTQQLLGLFDLEVFEPFQKIYHLYLPYLFSLCFLKYHFPKHLTQLYQA